MTLTIGTHLGSHEITALLGKGGMGEVYRARDLKLKREVAIKILPKEFSRDSDRTCRFQREAEVLASLNHPNIAGIYDLAEASGTRFLVLELVEGETLADRIARGPIPADEALYIAKQIAEALEAAHERGVIHRDLKPANVKVTPEGKVKVLDFGLAKAMEGAPTNAMASNSPTLLSGTMGGVLIGTAAYMAPEQARGKKVDQRADIWAFGVVLFEMLTGHSAFKGEDLTEILASVVKDRPDLSLAPRRARKLLEACLEKDPGKRLQSIGDMRLLIGDDEPAEGLTPAVVSPPSAASRLPWAIAFALAAVVIMLAVPTLRHLRETPSSGTLFANLTMDVAPAQMLGPARFNNRPARTAFAISPDGTTIVFVGETKSPSQTRMLYKRLLSDAQAVTIPGTENAEYPFFSPDGQWIGFGTVNKLKKVSLGGGPPLDICDLNYRNLDGANWGSRGIIVFAGGESGLSTVPAIGGKPETLFGQPNTHITSPQILPDGHTVLFTEKSAVRGGKWEEAQINAINLATKKVKTLITNGADARYSPTGHLIFVRNAALLAAPFDGVRVEPPGAPVPLLAGIMQSINAPDEFDETGMGQFALSASGTLIYASGDRYPTPSSTLVRIDRKGAETKLAEVRGSTIGIRISPSGSRLVAFKTLDGSRASDLWMYELPSGTPTRLTYTGGSAWPLFSVDGKSVWFAGGAGMFSLPLDGSNAPKLMSEGKTNDFPTSWSPDGKWLAYVRMDRNLYARIFVRPIGDSKSDRDAQQFSPSTFNQRDAEFSPDGQWIAYVSNESGSAEVYVQPFPGPGAKHHISTNGGANPVWSRNGRELFYIEGNRSKSSMMAVDVSLSGEFKAGKPHRLFDATAYPGSAPLRSYDVTPDGQFIMNHIQEGPDQAVTKLNIVLGWANELKRRVPSRQP
jgi:serine/threonine-protein kinase